MTSLHRMLNGTLHWTLVQSLLQLKLEKLAADSAWAVATQVAFERQGPRTHHRNPWGVNYAGPYNPMNEYKLHRERGANLKGANLHTTCAMDDVFGGVKMNMNNAGQIYLIHVEIHIYLAVTETLFWAIDRGVLTSVRHDTHPPHLKLWCYLE
jgi:hypothetical protein